jgi:hypothetical protein
MGNYTEFIFKAKLRQDTPDNVIEVLKRVLIDRDLGHNKTLFTTKDVSTPDIDHPFFKCNNWYGLFLCTNWGDIQGGRMYRHGFYWKLDIHTEFRNYDSEIEKFVNWITPFVVGRKKKQYLGCYRNENMNAPINIYIER